MPRLYTGNGTKTDTIYPVHLGYSYDISATVTGIYFKLCVCCSLPGTFIVLVSRDGRTGVSRPGHATIKKGEGSDGTEREGEGACGGGSVDHGELPTVPPVSRGEGVCFRSGFRRSEGRDRGRETGPQRGVGQDGCLFLRTEGGCSVPGGDEEIGLLRLIRRVLEKRRQPGGGNSSG